MTSREAGTTNGSDAACLSEDVIVGFVDGSLSRPERERVELHVDTCPACFGWMAALVRTSLLTSRGELGETLPLGDQPPLVPPRTEAQLAPGMTLGRYRIVEEIGRGSMGVVYRALDPILERHVAVKIIRGTPSSRVRLRAIQEAQALAKLQHPNVIAVYDVGFFGDQVFVAMELIEGQTLAGWIKQPRPWRDVRNVFVQAARGLGAAHVAGLVHRDFKPENVLLDKDGSRVVVTDFGLVCSLSVDGGRIGEMAGTPAYMAPEQFAGGGVDARTDVFNFCACLYECLYRQPAFAGDGIEARRLAVLGGQLRPLDVVGGPRWLHRVLLRGLHARPEDRHPSMAALITALDRNRHVVRAVVGSASLVLLTAIAVALGLALHSDPLQACRRRATDRDALWPARAANRVRDALGRAGGASGGALANRVATILSRHVVDWSLAYREICDATYARGDQSLDAFELRLECLQARRDTFTELVSRLESADASVAASAVSAASALEPPAACVRERPSPTRLPSPALRTQVQAARRRIAEARSYQLVAKLADAEQLLASLMPDVERLSFAPLQAEAWQATAYVRRSRGKPAEAEQAFLTAFESAERGGADELRARVAIDLVQVVGSAQARFGDGRHWAREAQAIASRLGTIGDADRASLAMNLGLLAQAEGKLDEAERELRAAVALRKQALAADSPYTPMTLGNLGVLLVERGEYEEGLRTFTTAHAQLERLVGATHPWTLAQLANVAWAQSSLGHFRAARSTWLEVLQAQERTLGPSHPNVINTLDNIADAEASLGDYDAAIGHGTTALERARANDANDVLIGHLQLGLALYRAQRGDAARADQLAADAVARDVAKLGADHPTVGADRYQLARIALFRRAFGRCRTLATDALRILDKSLGAQHPSVALTVDLLGAVDREARDYPAAITKHERALAVLEPRQHSSVPDVLTNLGLAQLLSGQRDAARATLTRAHDLRAKIEGDAQAMATTEFALARALPPTARAEAAQLASHALHGFTNGGRRFMRETAEVESWLRVNGEQED